MGIPINVTDDFRVPARDDKGHDANISFRCMSQIAGEVSEVIAQRAFNYRTAADLYRHALWRHLQWLKEKDPELRKRMRWVEAVIDIIQTKERFMELEVITNYLGKTAHHLQQRGEEEARRLVLHVINLICEGEGTTDWKRQYLRRIWKRHRHLLQGGASGKPSQFED